MRKGRGTIWRLKKPLLEFPEGLLLVAYKNWNYIKNVDCRSSQGAKNISIILTIYITNVINVAHTASQLRTLSSIRGICHDRNVVIKMKRAWILTCWKAK